MRDSSGRQASREMGFWCGLVEMAVEQVAASLKRVCLRQALTGRQLGQTLEHGCPGDDLTRNRASAAQRDRDLSRPCKWCDLLLRQRSEPVRKQEDSCPSCCALISPVAQRRSVPKFYCRTRRASQRKQRACDFHRLGLFLPAGLRAVSLNPRTSSPPDKGYPCPEGPHMRTHFPFTTLPRTIWHTQSLPLLPFP